MRNATLILTIVLTLTLSIAHAQGPITSPEKFFGFQLGADRKIARWDKIVQYYELLEKESAGRLKVVNMGPSTMGNPFLLVIISAAGNLSKLDRLREVNASISDPRGLTEQEVRKLVGEGKAVVCQTMSLHATEIGGTQMAPELAYDLLSRRDDETRQILDNVIFLMVPSFNPDGAIMVADWYQKTLGTEYEGGSLPWLYHKYAGHDNNRDAFQQNLVESQYVAKIMFRDWVPQAYIDHHHMGSYGARIYVPPYAEPMRPLSDPLVWREMSWYGAHIAYKEEEGGYSGVLNMAQYSGWGHFGFHWITPFHNIAGMLTESASAKLATPLYIHPHQLKGEVRGLPDYNVQTTFPNPWTGGWWKLRDIVERQKVSAWALLDLAARNRETVLWNAYLKAKRQTERGAQGKPTAYVIPKSQHDSLAAVMLVNKLLLQGIEVKQAKNSFTSATGMTYPAGSWVVPLAQPKMGVIRYLLGRTRYPDNDWTRARDGSPIRPYDMAADTMFEFMGVRVDPFEDGLPGDLPKLTGVLQPSGKVEQNRNGYSFDGRLNESFKALNLLLDKGVGVRRVEKEGDGLRAGDFVVSPGSEALLKEVAQATGVDFTALRGRPAEGTHELKRLRVAMYQRYRGGNIDEGWTRLLLEQYHFPYTTLMDAEVKKGGLNEKYDLIILPDDSTGAIVGETTESSHRDEPFPPEYRSGIGKEGVDALKTFVEKGGTLVALGGASNFAIEKLGLHVRNVTAGRSSKEFWCPGSTLKVQFDNTHPLAWGMPAEGLSLFVGGSPAFEILPNEHNDWYEVIVRYADRDLLESGWLLGEETLAKKAGMIAVKHRDGRVILMGSRPQHRAQTHGTFKLLFNALIR
ncbi:MAG TPA: M14 metallopeptidase family protein [Bryobacteraceae bacterium]|nr:M14 metallopeptidase family protein [Bryobacteraceae bacterium]